MTQGSLNASLDPLVRKTTTMSNVGNIANKRKVKSIVTFTVSGLCRLLALPI